MKGLTSFHIKLLAAITMLIDHVGVVFYPDLEGFRIIGRLSFPLFLWLLVEGEAHTRNAQRYGLRLGLLGLISQPIYQLTFDINRPNILFQLLIGLLCLRLIRQQPRLELLIWLLGAIVAEAFNVSYGSYGVVLLLLIRHFRPTMVWWFAWVGVHIAFTALQGPFQLPAIAAPLCFIWANGERGAKARWFYGFYPGHLALLSLIRWGLS